MKKVTPGSIVYAALMVCAHHIPYTLLTLFPPSFVTVQVHLMIGAPKMISLIVVSLLKACLTYLKTLTTHGPKIPLHGGMRKFPIASFAYLTSLL